MIDGMRVMEPVDPIPPYCLQSTGSVGLTESQIQLCVEIGFGFSLWARDLVERTGEVLATAYYTRFIPICQGRFVWNRGTV